MKMPFRSVCSDEQTGFRAGGLSGSVCGIICKHCEKFCKHCRFSGLTISFSCSAMPGMPKRHYQCANGVQKKAKQPKIFGRSTYQLPPTLQKHRLSSTGSPGFLYFCASETNVFDIGICVRRTGVCGSGVAFAAHHAFPAVGGGRLPEKFTSVASVVASAQNSRALPPKLFAPQGHSSESEDCFCLFGVDHAELLCCVSDRASCAPPLVFVACHRHHRAHSLLSHFALKHRPDFFSLF